MNQLQLKRLSVTRRFGRNAYSCAMFANAETRRQLRAGVQQADLGRSSRSAASSNAPIFLYFKNLMLPSSCNLFSRKAIESAGQ